MMTWRKMLKPEHGQVIVIQLRNEEKIAKYEQVWVGSPNREPKLTCRWLYDDHGVSTHAIGDLRWRKLTQAEEFAYKAGL